jgi:murein DD-endopeptidase MepM/ murein hydrolase activator NlpD
MRAPLLAVGAAAALSMVVVAGTTGVAAAVDVPDPGGVTGSIPTVSVPPLSTATPKPPKPEVTVPSLPSPPVSTDGPGGGSGPGGGAGGSDGSAGSGGSGSAGSGGDRPGTPSPRVPVESIKPMIAGRPEAAYVLDDELSPKAYRANKAFLRADRRILTLREQLEAMADAKAGAKKAAVEYRELGREIFNARALAEDLSQRRDRVERGLATYVRMTYQNGMPASFSNGVGTSATMASAADADRVVGALTDQARRLDETLTKAEQRRGWMSLRQAQAKEVFDSYAADYADAGRVVARIKAELRAAAKQRDVALERARATRGDDRSAHRARLAESGALGAQIRAASAQLRASGRTVTGSGDFQRPSTGPVTSEYGMRYHPVLRYNKLHTGLDLGAGNGTVYAADAGRVLFTVVSEAYGNFTVIDHGRIDGRDITTAYAHQARFLVDEGDRVRKGQPIGVVGATGYSTGPHLHFEVRDGGAVENPVPWL